MQWEEISDRSGNRKPIKVKRKELVSTFSTTSYWRLREPVRNCHKNFTWNLPGLSKKLYKMCLQLTCNVPEIHKSFSHGKLLHSLSKFVCQPGQRQTCTAHTARLIQYCLTRRIYSYKKETKFAMWDLFSSMLYYIVHSLNIFTKKLPCLILQFNATFLFANQFHIIL